MRLFFIFIIKDTLNFDGKLLNKTKKLADTITRRRCLYEVFLDKV